MTLPLFPTTVVGSMPRPQYVKDIKSLRKARALGWIVDQVVKEDRPVLDLLTARYTFVNERLAKHYGIPNIVGNNFKRVTLPADSPRGKLIDQLSRVQ